MEEGGNAMTTSDEYITIPRDEYLQLTKGNKNLLLVKTVFEQVLNGGKPKGKMFNIVTKTWNPVTGCLHQCNYCWARDLATTKLRNSHRYEDGFNPRINLPEFQTKFKAGEIIFVSDMGDLFGNFIPAEWIQRVLEFTLHFPKTLFLFLTKNPTRYGEFLSKMPDNAILGATIETNRDQKLLDDRISKAPPPSTRYTAMRNLNWDKKFISVEPVLDFDLDVLSRWIKEIFPFLVYVGYDNYNHRLAEPPQEKTLKLIDALSKTTLVVKKTIRHAWFETLGK